MFVKKIRLKNYRGYDELELGFDKGINILSGDNAQGKTNLLEAVYYCSSGRSHRTTKDKECIYLGREEALIKIVFERSAGREEQIEIHLKQNGKKSLAINGYPARRINDLFGRLHVVLFSPEDLSLIKRGPAERRKFIDMEICQVDPVYLYDLQQYYKVLRQRNQLLKDASKDRNYPTYTEKLNAVKETLFAWDAQLVSYGVKVMKRRESFVSHLQEYTSKIHRTISHETEEMKLSYLNSVPMEEDQFLEILEKDIEQDLRYGMTSSGPQHDDLIILINGTDIRKYGSQGQQRTAALSLKLSELSMMREEIGESPVLLLDDVMSELDENRQKQLAEYVKDHQTIMTCTGVEDSIRLLPVGAHFHVKAGKVTGVVDE